MRELGKKQLILELDSPLQQIPQQLASFQLEFGTSKAELIYTYDTQAEHTGITALLAVLADTGIKFHDVKTTQSSLEEIFVDLVKKVG